MFATNASRHPNKALHTSGGTPVEPVSLQEIPLPQRLQPGLDEKCHCDARWFGQGRTSGVGHNCGSAVSLTLLHHFGGVVGDAPTVVVLPFGSPGVLIDDSDRTLWPDIHALSRS